jgi:hypothetical protein
MRQGIVSTTTVDFPEPGAGGGAVVDPDGGTSGDVVFPLYSLAWDETIDSTYIGGVVGVATATALSDTMTLNVGGEARIYSVSSDYEGASTASVSGGSPSVLEEVAAGATSSSADDVAFGVKGQVGVSWLVADQMQLTLGGSAEYLSKVATVDRPDSPSMAPGFDASPSLSFGDMWSFGGTISLTGQF